MKWMTHINEALLNLFAAKLRSLLALLGILVGTASVVSMISGGELATNEALKQFKTLGTDLLAVNISDASAEPASVGLQNNLSLSEANNILNIDKNIVLVAPYTQLFNSIQFNGHDVNGAALGVTESFSDIVHTKIIMGRFISNLDHYEPFCVIGDGIYQQIKRYSLANPIGQQIQIGKNILTIIGVLAPWPENSFVYASIDNSVILPLETSLTFSKYAVINNIVVKLRENSSSTSAEENIENYLQKILSGKKYFFRSAKELVTRMAKQSEILTVFLGLIGSVSLIVGGIGVMNIMLVSVVERRREIGIRLAVGATARDIRLLFLVEAIVLALVGGLLGVILGIIIAFIISLFWHWEFTLFLFPPFVGFFVSTATGIFFGFYPAHKASQLDPIQALRSE
jgi:putative ABC transport system permease protein